MHGKNSANLCGRTKNWANFEELINFTRSWEERSEGKEFSHDTTNSPNINWTIVKRGSKEDFRGSIPTHNPKIHFILSLMWTKTKVKTAYLINWIFQYFKGFFVLNKLGWTRSNRSYNVFCIYVTEKKNR